MKAVAAGDEVAFELGGLTVACIGDPRSLGLEVVDGDIGNLEVQFAVACKQRGDQVLDDLLLPVDRHVATGQLGNLDVLRAARAPEVDAVVDQPFAVQPRGDVEVTQQVDRVLLEQPRAHAPLEVLTRASFEDHRIDSGAAEQQCECQSGRPGADDPDLRATLTHPRVPSRDTWQTALSADCPKGRSVTMPDIITDG